MRALFLLALATLLLAGCSGDLRTHPVARNTSAAVKPIASPEDPLILIKRELASADFSQLSPNSPTWQKGTKNGGIIVTLSLENGIKATVQYNRTDGKVICKIPEPRETLVNRIREIDSIASAAQLIAKHGCTPA